MNGKQLKLLASMLFLSLSLAAQYEFTEDVRNECTSVKSQGITGTCWSFTTSSFLESEIIRSGHEPVDLSEMYVVRHVYEDKARNYILRQGSAAFSEGSLSHDLMRTMDKHGLVPESVYPGNPEPDSAYNHQELVKELKGILDETLKADEFDKNWFKKIEKTLDDHFGEVPESFEYKGKTYTPKQFSESLGLRSGQYVTITSFVHHPFGQSFILEIPDNYSNGSYLNMPLNDLQSITDEALKSGYTVAWDGDISEKGFSSKNGLAILPEKIKEKKMFDDPQKEVKVTQEKRQEQFEFLESTDDHLMHIVGLAHDQNGTKYYIVKNSWGADRGPYEGYLYMSEAYFLMKTIAVMLPRKVVPAGYL